MHGAKYPLEQLAQIKEKKCEEAERLLNEKKRLLAKEEEKLKALEKERDTVKSHKIAKLTQLRAQLDEGTTSDKVEQSKRYLKVVDEELAQKEKKVTAQKSEVEKAEKEVEKARQELLKRQQAVEKMKLHRKEWDKEQKRLEEQKEGIESDELGSTMHLLRKKAKKTHNQEEG